MSEIYVNKMLSDSYISMDVKLMTYGLKLMD